MMYELTEQAKKQIFLRKLHFLWKKNTFSCIILFLTGIFLLAIGALVFYAIIKSILPWMIANWVWPFFWPSNPTADQSQLEGLQIVAIGFTFIAGIVLSTFCFVQLRDSWEKLNSL